MAPFQCSCCGHTVFFDNTLCGHCGAELGYSPVEARMVAAQAPERLRRCSTHATHGFCNWLQEDNEPDGLCASCRLTRVLPDLAVPGNLEAWQKIESAKKRMLVNLAQLGLLPEPKAGEDDLVGLSFEFLASVPGEPPTLTGHANGVITLNIAEADDVFREQARVAFGEPVRNLLGHLRHEVSHYLQYRWLSPDAVAMQQCREVFGDESADYAEALATHHREGPPVDWQSRFISAYASAHPWEDWAETCAHVLLVVDAVDTAAAWGVRLDGPAATAEPDSPEAGHQLESLVLDHWLPVAQFLTAMNRSLGQPDSYPFLIPDEVLRKMKCVHALLRRAACQRLPEAG